MMMIDQSSPHYLLEGIVDNELSWWQRRYELWEDVSYSDESQSKSLNWSSSTEDDLSIPRSELPL
jgi:hypothetical protein